MCSLLFGSKLGFSRILDPLYGAFWRCSRIRLYNSAESEPIWMKFGALWAHCWSWLALADFISNPPSNDSWRATRNFLSGKQRTISPIFPLPNFTKFEHNTLIGVAIKAFETEFWKFYPKGSFFQKRKNVSKSSVLQL